MRYTGKHTVKHTGTERETKIYNGKKHAHTHKDTELDKGKNKVKHTGKERERETKTQRGKNTNTYNLPRLNRQAHTQSNTQV